MNGRVSKAAQGAAFFARFWLTASEKSAARLPEYRGHFGSLAFGTRGPDGNAIGNTRAELQSENDGDRIDRSV